MFKVQLAVIPQLQRLLERGQVLPLGHQHVLSRAIAHKDKDAPDGASDSQFAAITAQRKSAHQILVTDAGLAAGDLGGPRRPRRPAFPCVPFAVPTAGKKGRSRREEQGVKGLSGTRVVAQAYEWAPRGSRGNWNWRPEAKNARLTVRAGCCDDARPIVQAGPDALPHDVERVRVHMSGHDAPHRLLAPKPKVAAADAVGARPGLDIHNRRRASRRLGRGPIFAGCCRRRT
mmetsp:Transcript_8463/g.21774  ORF Transcript_8463/g.21774 Transcript_8463/m.21774 type:complete len:231 (+) Transcript_8463:814-1506(+)